MGNVTLVDEDIVIISELDVLRNVSTILDQQSARTLQNYLLWRVMMSQVEYMPKRFRAIKQQFIKVFQGITTEKSRAIKCATYVADTMGLAVSKLYIMEHFDKNARQEVNENNFR